MASHKFKINVGGPSGCTQVNSPPEPKPTETFDAVKVKKEFLHLTYHQTQNEVKGVPPFMSNESLNLFIKQLKNNEITSDDYQLHEENGETILIEKNTQNIKKVLSAEQCYNILLEAHLDTGHGDIQTVSEKLTKYSVPEISIKTVIIACNVCAELRNIEMEKRVNNLWTVTIKNVSKFNTEFPFVLFYVETNSSYILIRPLKTNKCDEVALELFKIFMTYGPPATIYISEKYLKVMTKVQERIKAVHPECAFKLCVCIVNSEPLKHSFTKVMKRNNINYTIPGYLQAQHILNNMNTPQSPRDHLFTS